MRRLLIVVLVLGLGYVFLRQKQNEKMTVPNTAHSSAAVSPALTPAPPGQASEYNFMKRDIDRAQAVRDQARARTEEAQNP
jgi:hypothetical protein